jgi:hypothetical protein
LLRRRTVGGGREFVRILPDAIIRCGRGGDDDVAILARIDDDAAAGSAIQSAIRITAIVIIVAIVIVLNILVD